MSSIVHRLTLPYSPEQLFDMVVDIERYPDFVPGWRAVRVQQREPGHLKVDQLVGRGALSLRFATEAWYRRPESIRIRSRGRMLRYLVILWRFTPDAAAGGTRLSFRARYRLRTRLFSGLAAKLVESSLEQTVAAFAARAHALYGK